MIRLVALIAAFVGAAVLLVTGFGWFGSSTDSAQGWLGLALVGIVVAMADLDGRIASRHRSDA